MVGDTTADIEAGRLAGVRTILVGTGHGGRDDNRVLRPDYVVADIAAAVDWVLVGHTRLAHRMQATALACHAGVRTVLLSGGGNATTDSRQAAQVLKDLAEAAGRTAHVVPAHALVGDTARLLTRQRLALSIGARHPIDLSVGPEDLLLVHGGTELLQPPWSTLPPERVLVVPVDSLSGDHA